MAESGILEKGTGPYTVESSLLNKAPGKATVFQEKLGIQMSLSIFILILTINI